MNKFFCSLLLSFGLFSSSYGVDYYYGTDKGAETEMSDEDLTRKVREKLQISWNEYWFNYVNVEINHGIATLQGTVRTYDDKNNVESIVKNSDGVRKLISKLRVQNPAFRERQKSYPVDFAATDTDIELNRKIRDQISRGWLGADFKQVHLNTSNGAVILEGVVDNLLDQGKLVSEIQKIRGVASVTTHLTNKNTQERPSQN